MTLRTELQRSEHLVLDDDTPVGSITYVNEGNTPMFVAKLLQPSEPSRQFLFADQAEQWITEEWEWQTTAVATSRYGNEIHEAHGLYVMGIRDLDLSVFDNLETPRDDPPPARSVGRVRIDTAGNWWARAYGVGDHSRFGPFPTWQDATLGVANRINQVRA